MIQPPSLPPFEENDVICFNTEDIDFVLENEEGTEQWLKQVIEQEGRSLRLLNFIFCNDEYLHQLNVEYLQHDTLTDVITFPYAEPPIVEGDIFISIDRVRENASIFQASFEKELSRVMVHGVLHLCGHGDKTEAEEANMRNLEDNALKMIGLS